MQGSQSARKRNRQLKFLVLGAAGAGKTSLLRRYFYKQFDYERVPTLGSDFYVGRVPNPVASADNEQITVNLQMWDTPGKENFALKRKRHVHYSASLSDSFFQHADAIMLVYDMTSSTSFTRLLKWYGDLMELFSKTTALPILIVANKLDLFQADKPGARHPPPSVSHRDVLGLAGNYYGKNFQYEYHVCPPVDNSSADPASFNNVADATRKREQPGIKGSNKKRMEISTYLVNRDNWTTDGSYLESLLHSEDGSHPDREMVLLWCMRNGLQLCEISAATGEGVNEAVEALVVLALEFSSKETEANGKNGNLPTSSIVKQQFNEELDLQNRYAKKDDNCFFFFPPLRHCLNK
jgi:small GTP-binding protein